MSLPSKKVDIVDLKGGLDFSSTFIKMPPGAAFNLTNFEPALGGGYRLTQGYERVDGRTAPSAALYYTVGVADGTGISVGDTLTGDSSGATSRVVIKDGNTLGVTVLVGTYTLSESANSTTITAVQELSGQSGMETDDTWQLAANDYYRSLIGAVPGNGNALYSFQYGADKYAFRADSTVVKLYKSSAAGWVVVPFFQVLFFDAGVMADGEIVEGTTVITGATSGATGTVKRFIKNGGDFAADATGYFIVDATGIFSDNENIQVSAVTKCAADGVSANITLATGGKFQHRAHNFYGSTATRRIYGCDGINPAWEFDGVIFVPMYFPTPNHAASFNKPSYLVVHKTYLFLFFATGQMAHSAPGLPLIFSSLMGSLQFGLGDVPTGAEARSGDVLAIYTRNMTYGLYGTSSADWELRVISESFGAIGHTAQKVGTVYSLDDKGIAPLERVNAYGDFESATVSRNVQPIIDRYKNRIVGSVAVRGTNQYRLYFDDGTVLVMGDDQYLGESLPDFSTLEYPDIPTFVSSSEDESGNQVILFGDASGYVYESNKGYNFDGENIDYAYRSPYMHQNSPQLRKGFRRLYIDLEASRSVTMRVAYGLGYGNPAIPSSLSSSITAESVAGFWNIDNWNEFFWDVSAFSSQGISLSGTANNIAVIITGSSKTTRPFTIQTLELHYLPRRLRRE